MLSDQELNEMLDRSIQAGKAVRYSQADELEKQYNQLIHGLLSIHQHSIRGVEAMQNELEIMRECFDTISAKFVR